MTAPDDELRDGARRILGRDLSGPERAAISKYLETLVKWQKVHRLTGSTDPEWLVRNLVLDSLLFTGVLPASARTILDLGSGAGVPGIPLAIVYPEKGLVLLESRQRRASFLSEVVRTIPLRNCRVVAERAETASESLAGRFDAVAIRCAGDPREVLPVARRFLGPGGVIVLSGPPKERATTEGRWVEVDGVESGTRRRFMVCST